MSSERDKSHELDPFGGVTIFTYDSYGRRTSAYDGTDRSPREDTTSSADPNTARPAGFEPGQGSAAAPCLRHCFVFRLCGSETQVQTLALTHLGSAPLIVAIERVRVYLSGAAAPASAIGGVEVNAVLRGDRVLCTAQVSDLPAGELVVVEVDVAVFALSG